MRTRPCWAEIDLSALRHNLSRIEREAGGARLAAVVKANAYGHSLALCVPALCEAGAEWLAVTSTDEARELTSVCLHSHGNVQDCPRILILSGPFAGDGEAIARHGFVTSVWQREHLEELQRGARAVGCSDLPVHLEIDTGMSRQGVGLASVATFADRMQQFPALRLDGAMTHLYAADEGDHAATRRQLERLATALHALQERGCAPKWLSVGNSAAIFDAAIRERLLALATAHGMRLLLRPGIALYGVAPEFLPPLAHLPGELRPVLSWKTRVTSLLSIQPGETVGYNATFRAERPMRLALLAAGYADGLSRKLSNVGHVMIAGHRAPFVGRISMDQSVVDVSHIGQGHSAEDGLAPGAEAVLLGRQGDETVTADDHARWAGTISWEVFTGIAARVPRIVTGEIPR